MKKFTYLMILVAGLLSISAPALAKNYARLGGYYSTDETGPEGAEVETKRLLMDIGAGHIWSNGFTLGLLYGTEKYESGGGSLERKAYGPTLGWIANQSNGPFVLFTYFLKVERSDNFAGTGMQLDLGYKFSGRPVGFAPQLTYRSLAYDKAGGAPMNPKYMEKKIEPYFVAWFEF